MQQILNDYDIDDAIHNRERNYKLFLKIVGENPLDQIDWIIENGLDKFNYWFRCYETGRIHSPATVREFQPYIETTTFEIRGGQGNQLLTSFESKEPHDTGKLTVNDRINSCLILGHKWSKYNHVESQCVRCERFKIFWGIAETEVYKNAIKPKGV